MITPMCKDFGSTAPWSALFYRLCPNTLPTGRSSVDHILRVLGIGATVGYHVTEPIQFQNGCPYMSHMLSSMRYQLVVRLWYTFWPLIPCSPVLSELLPLRCTRIFLIWLQIIIAGVYFLCFLHLSMCREFHWQDYNIRYLWHHNFCYMLHIIFPYWHRGKVLSCFLPLDNTEHLLICEVLYLIWVDQNQDLYKNCPVSIHIINWRNHGIWPDGFIHCDTFRSTLILYQSC